MDTLVLDGDVEEIMGGETYSSVSILPQLACEHAFQFLFSITQNIYASIFHTITNMARMVQESVCYRVAKSRIPETSALTNVPCGICPVSMPND